MSGDTERFSGVNCTKETTRAILVQFDDDEHTQTWIPKSVVHDDSEVWAQGHTGDLVVERWWAEKEGIA